MRLLVDTTPLRVSRDFRRLWIGQAISFFGSMITTAALPYQVFHETGSSLAVGLLGIVQLGPLLLFSLVGGAMADGFDKRRLLLAVTAISTACSIALAINASLDHPQLWLLYALGAGASAMFAVSFPVLRSLLPLLLEDDLRPAAFALQSTYGSFGMMAGPAVAGLLIGLVGLTSAYVADVATYALALVVFSGIAPSPPVKGAETASRSSILDGVRFVRGQSIIVSIFLLDLLAMIFGMPRALFPALAERLGGGPELYGLLLASVAAGAFVASLASGWTTRVVHQGRAVLWAVTAWGITIAVAGLTTQIWLVLLMLACAGAADMISGVYRSTIAAAVTPDEMRGRVSGVEIAVYAGGPVLGDVEAGVVGGLVGVPFAIVSGGLACVAAAGYFAVKVRSFATYVKPGARVAR
ncbi:MAG TPA: MFS transporter [Acidimicrobiales bacterium]|jgi:MFS family permease|nr:MFS transporter [Acidimicrobiales bacterium]